MINFTNDLEGAKRGLEKTFFDLEKMHSSSNIELCRIEKVNTDRYTVKAFFFKAQVVKDNIPFCFPYHNLDMGMLYMPEEGSIGLAFWDRKKEPIILVFFNPPTLTEKDGGFIISGKKEKEFQLNQLPALLGGEILIGSPSGRGFVRWNALGDVEIYSALLHFSKLISDKGLWWNSFERVRQETHGRDFYEGIKYILQEENGVEKETPVSKSDNEHYTHVKEDYYESIVVKEELTDEELRTLTREILQGEDEAEEEDERSPIITIEKGNVFDGESLVKLEDINGVEKEDLCYRWVLNKEGKKISFEIDKSGNIKKYINGQLDIEVSDGDVNVHVGKEETPRNVNLDIQGNLNINLYKPSEGNGIININIEGDTNIEVHGKTNVESHDDVTINASESVVEMNTKGLILKAVEELLLGGVTGGESVARAGDDLDITATDSHGGAVVFSTKKIADRSSIVKSV